MNNIQAAYLELKDTIPSPPRTAHPLELLQLFYDWSQCDHPIARYAFYSFILFIIIPVVLGTLVILFGLHEPKSLPTSSSWIPFPFIHYMFKKVLFPSSRVFSFECFIIYLEFIFWKI